MSDSPRPFPALLALLFSIAWFAGCPPPESVAVDLQVDLQVEPAADPFDEVQSVRVCIDADGATAFELFPVDPGSYLIADLPEASALGLVVLGFDLDPDAIRLGEEPSVVAQASIAGAVLGGEPSYVSADFRFCDGDCLSDCSQPETLGNGTAAIGLRRAEKAAP